ncbi:MarR family winged helix-turn-helix transcriptional regulator [Nevskia sp.]|uniref:MarR family winged helix-turn-helix transcriptional regulator n=1 Tax=Nevskia sp. TaxID=1929292 RepID=UPI0025FB714D|nr:MarR family winged helix-turn-helix transcriptional regulator [Nevskia sp.]
MNTNERLRAVFSSMPSWQLGVPELSAQDVLLMRLLRVASQGITACVDPVIRPAGLTESSFHTLIIVMAAGAEGTTPTALCTQVGQAAANMTRILEVLRRESLIDIRLDSRDGRRRRVFVTELGASIVQGYAGRLAPIVSAALAGISATDKATFERLLLAIVASLDKAEAMADGAA